MITLTAIVHALLVHPILPHPITVWPWGGGH